MVEPVLTELLSFQAIHPRDREGLTILPRTSTTAGYWERSGETRRKILSKGLKPRTIDCLIAQACLDADLPLIADDVDFRHFVPYGLKLA